MLLLEGSEKKEHKQKRLKILNFGYNFQLWYIIYWNNKWNLKKYSQGCIYMHIQADSINNYCQFTFQSNPNQCQLKTNIPSHKQTLLLLVMLFFELLGYLIKPEFVDFSLIVDVTISQVFWNSEGKTRCSVIIFVDFIDLL